MLGTCKEFIVHCINPGSSHVCKGRQVKERKLANGEISRVNLGKFISHFSMGKRTTAQRLE